MNHVTLKSGIRMEVTPAEALHAMEEATANSTGDGSFSGDPGTDIEELQAAHDAAKGLTSPDAKSQAQQSAPMMVVPFGFPHPLQRSPQQRSPLTLSILDKNVAVKKGAVRRTKTPPKAAKPDRITGRPFTCDSLVLFFPDDPHVEEYDVVDELQEGGEAKVGSHVL